MKIKTILLSALLFVGVLTATAQTYEPLPAAAPNPALSLSQQIHLDLVKFAARSLVDGQVTNPVTSSPPPTQQSFYATVITWATSFDTNNLCFQVDSLSLWNGVKYQSGINIANSFGLDWTAYRFSTNGNSLALNVGSATDFAGITGVVSGQEITVGLSKTLYDLRMTPYVGGAYDFVRKSAFVPIGVDVRKATSAHVFVGLRGEEPIYLKGKQQSITVTAFGGFTL